MHLKLDSEKILKNTALWDEKTLNAAAREVAEKCPDAAHMAEHECTNRQQCWEPCGELGHSEEHVFVERIGNHAAPRAFVDEHGNIVIVGFDAWNKASFVARDRAIPDSWVPVLPDAKVLDKEKE